MFIIENNGPAIARTNYWETELAQSGFAYLSWNAGVGRLLLPDALVAGLQDMRNAEYVIVSRGIWAEHGKRDAWELLFEDHSDSPYCLTLLTEQSDRLLPDNNQGGGFDIAVWIRDGEAFRLPGKYRKVEQVPCMLAWGEH
ncbi:hypothetical protein [Pseudomonas aeruginosa]|uniref:hypothetical protein n=1 Tax=Pseudomonas aeruginosa TaxID=287 RepID=UPI000F7FA1B1|nr:hypothetical protein [Pseudomonas aeruginosa]RTB44096.1 hypothetical protein EJ655_08125 [Pseudomonas aeruginosa]